MSTSLRGLRGWDKKVRVSTGADAPKLNPKDPIQAAIMGRTIRDINNGNFENIGNLQTVATAFIAESSDSNAPVVIGRECITVMADPNGQEHRVSDASLVKVYLEQGMKIVSTTTEDIMG